MLQFVRSAALITVVILTVAGRASAAGCPGDPTQSIGPDIVVANITGPANYRGNGNFAACTLGSDACNLGNQTVSWLACPANTHPVFGGNMYRWQTVDGATRFEQIGQSWLKNGFGADQGSYCCSNCQPSGDYYKLGIGCDDAYLAQQAAHQSSLSPRSIVNPHTGYYPPGCTIHPSGQNAGLLEVDMGDLVITSGGAGSPIRYFCQHQYITADDALAHNQDNNASSRELYTSVVTGVWVFKFPAGSYTYVGIPAIRQWKQIDTGVVETDIDTPEDDGFPGLVIMAAKATDLGNGFWRYEYAVNNLNSDRAIATFSVPCSAYVNVQNIGFHDVGYRGGDGMGGQNFDGTDWPATVANGAITWATTPFAVSDNANALRWGTLYNFRFDADVAPASGSATLGEYKVVVNVNATTLIPSGVTCTKGDVNGDGFVDGADIAAFSQLLVSGGGTAAQKCAADVIAAPGGAIGDFDIDPFVSCILNGSCP